MLKSFDFLDPSIASKIKTLEEELQRVQQSKKQIEEDPRIALSTKSRLISFQDECYEHTNNLLNQEKQKLADYLDQQTTVITKENRQNQSRHSHKNSFNLNQSTRIDLSTDDNKSFQGTSHSEHYRKINSFYIEQGKRIQSPKQKEPKHRANRDRARIRQLSKKVAKQEQFIKMLVTWVKIYHERQQENMSESYLPSSPENINLQQQNEILAIKCKRLEEQIFQMKNSFRKTSVEILETHKKREEIRQENASLQLERKQLLNSARSLPKHHSTLTKLSPSSRK